MKDLTDMHTLQALDTIIPDLLAEKHRTMLFGESGTGKSTLARILARKLAEVGRPCTCLSADPGSPAFGPPGAVCLAEWVDDDWRVLTLEALCTLDAGRFRLPLISAVARLVNFRKKSFFLLDAPGLVRGNAGAEMLDGLVDAAAIDAVLLLAHHEKKIPLLNELLTMPARIIMARAASLAHYPGPARRTRERTLLWDRHLQQGEEWEIQVPPHLVTGTPPSLDAEDDWRGRQIALFKERKTLAMGEVRGVSGNTLRIRSALPPEAPDRILVRDACRNAKNRLITFRPERDTGLRYLPPSDVSPYPGKAQNTGPHPLARIGEATATLLNGIFGDPLLHLRLHNRKRSVLFDLGEGNRLSAHLAHQVTDVFISHCHLDHFSGFLWLMRSRIGSFPPCRLFGPPGLAGHIAALMNGILWDRIGDWGPRFTVIELHERQLLIYRLKAGQARREEPERRSISGDLLHEDRDLQVRAVTLDHAATPVLAYSLAQAPKMNVRKEKLREMHLPAGPWLGELKEELAAGKRNSLITLPAGDKKKAGELAEELLEIKPARKLVYATDFAESASNREGLIRLAAGAHLLFCEAAFSEENRDLAGQSGHLTARACGEIAREAGVGQLIPFHFSRRYERQPHLIYNEIKEYCSRVMVPRFSG